MKQKVHGFWRALRARPFMFGGLAVLAVLLGWWLFFSGNGAAPSFETATIERGSVLRVVSETGTVDAADDVQLAFTSSGRIALVAISKGESVSTGEVLVRIDSAQAAANLAQAQAALRAAEARASSGGDTRTQVMQQHDELVASAYRRLLSTDLAPVPESSAYTAQPPALSGLYDGLEGSYRLRVNRDLTSLGNYTMRTFGLETTGPFEVSRTQPTPLGTRGLYISFPDELAAYDDTIWNIAIPNTSSSSYLANYSAYQEALRMRDRALADASNAPVLEADIDQARATVVAAEAALAQTRIVAPFDGIVTAVSATAGEIAAPGTPVVSLISANRFEITVEIPEDDVLGVNAGDRAEVVFDALGDEVLEAEVTYVAPAGTSVEGGVSFEVVLQFIGEDPRVRAGLTADVDIYADSREDVLVVPVRAIIEEEGQRYVRVMEGETAYRRVPVTVGLRGGGFYEITGGLVGGERVITFANSAALSGLIDLGPTE